MSATEFYLGMLLVDDDPDIIEQHKFLLDNRAFRKQTPGRLYVMLRDAGLVESNGELDHMIDAGRWPTKADVQPSVVVNPDLEDRYRVLEPDVAYSAAEASEIWEQRKALFLSADVLSCYIVLLDHDMSVQTGLELAEEWRPLIGGVGPIRVMDQSPTIVFYTGRGPLLSETLAEEGYQSNLERVSSTGLAEAVLQKGVLRDEFNQLMWRLIGQRIAALVA